MATNTERIDALEAKQAALEAELASAKKTIKDLQDDNDEIFGALERIAHYFSQQPYQAAMDAHASVRRNVARRKKRK